MPRIRGLVKGASANVDVVPLEPTRPYEAGQAIRVRRLYIQTQVRACGASCLMNITFLSSDV
jgi:hypothetical protein